MMTAELPAPRPAAIECIGRELQSVRVLGANPQVVADLVGVRVSIGINTLLVVDIAGDPPVGRVFAHTYGPFRDQVLPQARAALRVCGGKIVQQWRPEG